MQFLVYIQRYCMYYSTVFSIRQHKIADLATQEESLCLPPRGKVAPQGRMRGRFPGGKP